MTRASQLYTHAAHLSAENLSAEKQDRWLFNDLAFQLEPGEMLHLRGANGSGKTTLLRILCGLTTAEQGEVHWGGKPIKQQRDEYHSQLSYVGHTDGIKQDLSVSENLKVAAVLARGKQQKPKPIDINQTLMDMGLNKKKHTFAHDLSAGQRRRLALARCLLNETSIWILDEPLTALDKHGVGIVEDMINAHLQRNGMAIVTSHQDLNINEDRCKDLNLS